MDSGIISCAVWLDGGDEASAQRFACQQKLPLFEAHPAGCLLLLRFCESGISLIFSDDCAQTVGPLDVDFTQSDLMRRSVHKAYGEMLVKAVGVKKYGFPLTVVDATTGLGRESFLLAAAGCEVIAMEQSPVLAMLLQQALERAIESPPCYAITQRISLKPGDSKTLLAALKVKPDVVYLDPMFPERQKSAKVKKSMQYLQALVGKEAGDADELLSQALQVAGKRVVVKRPRVGNSLMAGQRLPDFKLEGKSHRFDIYSIT